MKVSVSIFSQNFRQFLVNRLAPQIEAAGARFGLGFALQLPILDGILGKKLQMIGLADSGGAVDLDAVRNSIYGGFSLQEALPIEELAKLLLPTETHFLIKPSDLAFTRDDADDFL